MTIASAGHLLSLPSPQLEAAKLASLARTYWGVTGSLTSLTSERDQNHRLDTQNGSFVLKLANSAEDPALTEAQTLALLHVEATAPDLPAPRVVAARDGRTIISTPDGALRLLTWCEGIPLALLPRSPGLSTAIGRALGRLDATLSTYHHPATDHPLLWDIRNAAGLAPLIPSLPTDLQPQAAAYLRRFDSHIAPALARLPRQVIHGDFNPHNLLADPARPDVLTGILDFGDMTLSHRICDLAVAGSYLIDPEAPLGLLMPLVTGYHATNPLHADEIAVLPDLLTARLITTLTISAWRAARYPENAPYILRNAPASRTGLAALGRVEPARLAAQLQSACERPHG
ncbi:MAG: phosphotransferase [Rhodobacterales bacterium]|nr:phosphotransferase [Rhodobacterales bacterium]